VKDASPRNRLAGETSPYLLQHAANPVDWYPWGEEALERARREDRPILLSIGYSACHWCHVMAHESFEDEATAERMNALFVNIKVDREERPDLDKIYQLAHQLLSRRSGGWPLTVFLNPHNQLPYFTGTYFPPRPAHNLPAFVNVLEQAAGYYHSNKAELDHHNTALQDFLGSMHKRQGGGEGIAPSPRLLDAADRSMAQHFDKEHGGFGGAPKFPHTSALQYLLERWHCSGRTDDGLRHMACFSLEKMARGGLYDQIGGGFYRYSVDGWWEIPHFEKMLYDNGPLLGLYAQVWQVSGNALCREVAEETGDWVMREMQSREGGYYASLDADSEGEEGRFYLWRRDAVRRLLSGPEFSLAAACYGLEGSPNFEGAWHLQRTADPAAVAGRLGLEPASARELLACAEAKLLTAREERVRPGRDGKILTSWNALMIQGMALAGRVLKRADFIDSAEWALGLLRHRLWQDGRLRAAYKDGQAKFPAYLDDHAFLLDACLELVQSRWSATTLEWARTLADVLLERFYDSQNGGFYFTAHDHETLMHRPKPLADESMPAGCGVAAAALMRLGHLLGEGRYLEAAERTLAAAVSAVAEYPLGHAALLRALQLRLHGVRTVIIRGQPEAMESWVEFAHSVYDPALLCLAIPREAGMLPQPLSQWNTDLPVAALVCESTHCLPPIVSFQEFRMFIERAGAYRAGRE
jgi:uncharacterized protein YyaL (SSP411 family)